MADDGKSARSIEREIEEERAELRRSMDEIMHRLTFEEAWSRAGQYVKQNGSDYGPTVGRLLREKPYAVGLIALGVAWLAFGPSLSRHPRDDRHEGSDHPELQEGGRFSRGPSARPGSTYGTPPPRDTMPVSRPIGRSATEPMAGGASGGQPREGVPSASGAPGAAPGGTSPGPAARPPRPDQADRPGPNDPVTSSASAGGSAAGSASTSGPAKPATSAPGVRPVPGSASPSRPASATDERPAPNDPVTSSQPGKPSEESRPETERKDEDRPKQGG